MKQLVLFFIVVITALRSFDTSVVYQRTSEANLFALQENTKYCICGKIDLKGETLQIPHGCVLVFWGGSISNGNIVFDSTKIKGHPRFRNCQYKGNIKIRKIDDRDFTSSDDKGTFVFLFSNAVKNGIQCDFHRDYHISMEGVKSSGVMLFEDIDSRTDIRFHGCSLYNTYAFPSRAVKPIIVLRNVKNITIRDFSFYDVEGHNTHLMPETNGCTFIQCYGDCEGINLLNCYQENGDCILRSGVYRHDSNLPKNTPTKGLTNSTLKVKSKNTGYGLALYCGDNLNIDIDVNSPHRGFYCTGVSNSIIRYKGYNPVETKCHILIKDAVYKKKEKNGDYSLDMKGCSNLTIKAIIDELLLKEKVISFSTYGSGRKENADFRFRSEPCHHSNIDFTADIKHYSDEGPYYIVSINSDSGALNDEDMIGCKVTDIRIHDIYKTGGNAKGYLCMAQKFTDSQIEFVNCTASDPELGYDFAIVGNAKGSVRIRNSNVGTIYVREKSSGEFTINTENTRMNGELVYIKDQAHKELVRLIKSDN